VSVCVHHESITLLCRLSSLGVLFCTLQHRLLPLSHIPLSWNACLTCPPAVVGAWSLALLALSIPHLHPLLC